MSQFFNKVANLIGMTPFIRLDGDRSYEDLTFAEIALMIEADSSISPEGNESFHPAALDDFLHGFEPKRSETAEIQRRLLDNIYTDRPGTKTKSINTAYLIEAAAKLKNGELP